MQQAGAELGQAQSQMGLRLANVEIWTGMKND